MAVLFVSYQNKNEHLMRAWLSSVFLISQEIRTLWDRENRRADLGYTEIHRGLRHQNTKEWILLTWRSKWNKKLLSKFLSCTEIANAYFLHGSRDSAVGIATGYGLDYWAFGVRFPVGSWIFSSPRRPNRLWGPPSLLSNRYWGLFPRCKAAGVWNWPLTSK
jgi:hypothetical protein